MPRRGQSVGGDADEGHTMGCLFAMFAGLFPRLALFMLWVARPGQVDAAFESWIWPFLGIIFPAVHDPDVRDPSTAPGGLVGFDWFWIGLAVFFDLAHTATGYSQRRQVPGYPSGATT